jgi:hypothetical protein
MSRKIDKPGIEHLSNGLVGGARRKKKSPSMKDGLGNFVPIGLRLA